MFSIISVIALYRVTVLDDSNTEELSEDLESHLAVVSSGIGCGGVLLHVFCFFFFILNHAQCGFTCGDLVEDSSP